MVGEADAKEEKVIDPERSRAILREYHATVMDQQIVGDLRLHFLELARRLGVEAGAGIAQPNTAFGTIRGFFSTFGRSVINLFS
jgi:hypothetical protein